MAENPDFSIGLSVNELREGIGQLLVEGKLSSNRERVTFEVSPVPTLFPVFIEHKNFGEFHITKEKVRSLLRTILTEDALSTKRLKSGLPVEFVVRRPPFPKIQRTAKTASFNAWNMQAGTVTNVAARHILKYSPEKRLYQYQRDGVAWLTKVRKGLLCDDMGLGKTVQVACALRLIFFKYEINHTLIVCPKALLENWREELQKWCPEIPCAIVDPQQNNSQSVWEHYHKRVPIIITNYEHLRASGEIIGSLCFDTVVADEVHRIRKRDSSISKSFARLESTFTWGLTGTPIERDIDDFLTLLSRFWPNRFSTKNRLLPEQVISQFQTRCLRRVKKDVLKQLPPIVHDHEIIEMLPEQRKHYDQVLKDRGGFRNALEMLTKLRGIIEWDEESKTSCKIERVCEIIREIESLGEKVVVFSYLVSPLEILQQKLSTMMNHSRVNFYHGGLSSVDRQSVLKSFKVSEGFACLLASSKAAGEGLTLTEANWVIFLNRWWNPSANDQARDRVNRIGQTKNVFMKTFTVKDSIEEKLEKILSDKKTIIGSVLSENNALKLLENEPS